MSENAQPVFSIEKSPRRTSPSVPGAPQIFLERENPQVNVQLRTEGQVVEEGVHEVTLTVTVNARIGEDRNLFWSKWPRPASSRSATPRRRARAGDDDRLPQHPSSPTPARRCQDTWSPVPVSAGAAVAGQFRNRSAQSQRQQAIQQAVEQATAKFPSSEASRMKRARRPSPQMPAPLGRALPEFAAPFAKGGAALLVAAQAIKYRSVGAVVWTRAACGGGRGAVTACVRARRSRRRARTAGCAYAARGRFGWVGAAPPSRRTVIVTRGCAARQIAPRRLPETAPGCVVAACSSSRQPWAQALLVAAVRAAHEGSRCVSPETFSASRDVVL